MRQIHKQESDQFKKLFQQEQVDALDDRFKVLETFLNTEKHVSVLEMVELLQQQGHRFETTFVEDTLALMCRFGFAHENRFGNDPVRYEHRHLGQHHDHMICTKCQKIIEFRDAELESLQVQIAARNGFHMLQHRMEIYGICSACLNAREILIPLVMAKPGERLIIRKLGGGTGVRMRLLTMGLRLDDDIEVITNHHLGQMVIASEFKRYVIGYGLARKIMVQPRDPRLSTD